MASDEVNQLKGRRSFVCGALSAAAFFLLPSVSGKETWVLEKQIELDSKKPFDLSKTLPRDVRHGGRFSVDLNNGASLPEGIHLSADGLLRVQNGCSQNICGVVFTYEEPNFTAKGEFRG